MTALILDTETTGLDAPEVIELAWAEATQALPEGADLIIGRIQSQRFRPSKAIDFGAMAAHHIIASDLYGCQDWPGRWWLPAGTEYLIGHNIDFDWAAIGSPDVPRICTLALARSLWPDLDSHSLGALTYCFNDHAAARILLQHAHDAACDVMLCGRVLVQILGTLSPRPQTWGELWLASERARMPERMTFGKYGPDGDWAKANGGKGMRCAEVRRYDPGYYEWLFAKCDQVRDDAYLQKALRGEAA